MHLQRLRHVTAGAIAGMAVASALLFPAGCSQGDGATGTAAGPPGRGGPGMRGARAMPVAVAVVAPRTLSRAVTVSGPIEPIRTVTVSSQTTGTLVSVLVEEGDRVHTGELMAEFDAREAKAQLERARAVLANAEAAYRRTEQLEENELASEAEIDGLRSAFEIARADVELWSTRVAYCRVTAPVAGVVTDKRVEKGGTVGANQPLFEIADDSLLVVRVRVSELDVVHLEPGRPVTLRLDAYPEARLAGRIRRIFPSADPSSRLVPVEVELTGVPGGVAVRPGFLARVEFALDSRHDVLAVPAPAVGVSDSGSFVYVVRADTLVRRPVSTGLTAEGWIEITRGLEAGERVVSSGHVNLRQGTAVKVSETVPTSAGGAAAVTEEPAGGAS
jgi:membrane fusion protein (multidrug efflux system)